MEEPPRQRVIVAADAASLADALRASAPSGDRLRLTSGRPTASAASGTTVVSLEKLSAIEVDVASLTARAEAGATVTALRAAVEAAGLRIAGSLGTGSRGGAHVGSLLARGGVSRRALTGVEAVLTSGERVAVGGRMLKDVAPYDLAAALLGSQGRLAIIVAATFRLVPAGAAVPDHAPPGPVAFGPLDEPVRAAFDPDGRLVPAPG